MIFGRSVATEGWPPTLNARVGHDRAILWFASLAIFSLIYLQKIGLLGTSLPLSVPMLTVFAGVGWLIISQNISISAPRLAAYLCFVSALLVSFAITGGSVPSLLQIVLLYAPLTFCTTVTATTYRGICNRFVLLMIPPACIVIGQYVYQTLTGRTDPLDLEVLVPRELLLQGFNYRGHFPWNSPFIRPNGIFFLEPSVVSAFTASAAILEITYFRRPYLVLLFVAAIFLGMGGTGFAMLLIAAPFLLVREIPLVKVAVVAGVVVALFTVYMIDAKLPFVSRANELDAQAKGSSANVRLLMPAELLVERMFDPGYFFVGTGAGNSVPKPVRKLNSQKDLQAAYSSHVYAINPWPMVKLLNEYGLLSMTAFVALYLLAILGNFNIPLKVSLSAIYGFTGGYLLNPVLVDLILVLCVIAVPNRSKNLSHHPAADDLHRNVRPRTSPPAMIAPEGARS